MDRRNSKRSTAEIEANQIDMEIYRLAGRIDQFTEMVSRGKPKMDRALIEAARAVDSARSAIRTHMHEIDRVRTVG